MVFGLLAKWLRPLSRGEKWLLVVGLGAGILGGALLHASRTSGVLHQSGFVRSGAEYVALLPAVELTPGATVTFEAWFDRMYVKDDFPVTAHLVSRTGAEERVRSTYQCETAGITEGSIFRFGDLVPKTAGPWDIEAKVPASELPELVGSLAVRDGAFDWTWFSICTLMFALICITLVLVGRGGGGPDLPVSERTDAKRT
jgi:hypothetical protein